MIEKYSMDKYCFLKLLLQCFPVVNIVCIVDTVKKFASLCFNLFSLCLAGKGQAAAVWGIKKKSSRARAILGKSGQVLSLVGDLVSYS